MSRPQNIAPFYVGWRLTNEHLLNKVRSLSAEQLALSPAPDMWPIWATVAHLAGTRTYWLCAILKEPGAERTPFDNPTGEGWEDDLTHPRQSSELVFALESTWGIVEECLDRWTPDMLQVEFRREMGDKIQFHTRQSVLMRMITHDACHCGEISQTLGMNGLGELDLWTGRAARTIPAAT